MRLITFVLLSIVIVIVIVSRAGADETPKYPPMFPYPGDAEITLGDISSGCRG